MKYPGIEPATINGNTLTMYLSDLESLAENINSLQIRQFSVYIGLKFVELSTPVTSKLEELIPGVLHGARARAKAEDKPDPKPPTGGGNPDGTPPTGGTPGTPTIDQYTYTEARAA